MSDIQIAGATYLNVPQIIVPKVGGGFAEYNEGGGGTTILKPYAIRPDAELVKTFSYDKYAHADESITMPGYTTTSQTLKASAALSETYTVDTANYNYFIAIRCLSIPTYSVTTKGKGRDEYHVTAKTYEIADIPGGTFHAILSPTTGYATQTTPLVATGAISRLIYWSGSSAITAYSTLAYGVVQSIVDPSINSGVVTFNTPNFITRGHTTYFTSTYMNAMTDIRYQWIIQVYRAPKGNLNIDGWGQRQQILHIVDCVENNNLTLT